MTGPVVVADGKWSEPVTKFIEKISEAVEGLYRPHQIRRIAHAEADADKIRAVAQIEITELQRRAVQRLFWEEGQRQANMESITQKALPALSADAKPQDMENDWITNFFDKGRLISNDEMQTLYAKVLAGEANIPGRYSKRTVNMLASMDRSEAQLFRNLCSFIWVVGGIKTPLIYDTVFPVYTNDGINVQNLRHLSEIGLISFVTQDQYVVQSGLTESVSYFGESYEIRFAGAGVNQFPVGMALLSKSGEELSTVCDPRPNPVFKDMILDRWRAYLQVTPIHQ